MSIAMFLAFSVSIAVMKEKSFERELDLLPHKTIKNIDSFIFPQGAQINHNRT